MFLVVSQFQMITVCQLQFGSPHLACTKGEICKRARLWSFNNTILSATPSLSALFVSNTLCWMISYQAGIGLFGDQSCPYTNDLQQLPGICKPQWANWTHCHIQVSDPVSVSRQRNNRVFKFTYPALGTTLALLLRPVLWSGSPG